MPRQFQADISPATATLRQPQLSAPPSTAKTQIAHYNTTVPIRHTATKTNAAVITQPSSLFETERSRHTPALNPHRPTPLPAQTPPAVSSLEAFRTPASENLITSVNGRRPKTLNRNGHIPVRSWEAQRFIHTAAAAMPLKGAQFPAVLGGEHPCRVVCASG